MEKTILIEGMTCAHCKARVEKELNAIAGVNAVVDLQSKTAAVSMQTPVADELLKQAVEEAGYEVKAIN